MEDINKMTNQERAKKIMNNVYNRVGTKKEMMISPIDWTILRKIADSTSDGNPANSENANCAIFSVMASFLEQKAKEHKCKTTELNIGYSEGKVYLFKTYYDYDEKQSKVAWEQNLNTGEIIY